MKIEELPEDSAVPAVDASADAQNAAEDEEVDLLSAALNNLPTSTTKTTDELLADLNSHPLFMTELEENDDLEALRALQYEGTPLEIATNFKEQGNEVFKIRRWVDAKEFYNKGVAVLIAEVRKRQKEKRKLTAEEEDEVKGEVKVLEALLVNRAACHLELRNYRSCTLDCTAALGINPRNIKAHYRSAKALLALDRINDADEACAKGLELDPSNAPLQALAKDIIKRNEQVEARKKRELEQAQRNLLEDQTLRAALKARNIKVKKTAQPPEMEDAKIALVPDPVDPTSSLTFPTVLLYPLNLESDFIKAFGEMDTVGDHLEYMLPTPWDQRGEYTPTNVECYVETISGGLVKLGRKVNLLKVLSGGNVEVVDEVVKIFVVPKLRAAGWIDDFKRKKAAEGKTGAK
jgi:tetratricopeptide (TPR) repeat protein